MRSQYLNFKTGNKFWLKFKTTRDLGARFMLLVVFDNTKITLSYKAIRVEHRARLCGRCFGFVCLFFCCLSTGSRIFCSYENFIICIAGEGLENVDQYIFWTGRDIYLPYHLRHVRTPRHPLPLGLLGSFCQAHQWTAHFMPLT